MSSERVVSISGVVVAVFWLSAIAVAAIFDYVLLGGKYLASALPALTHGNL